MTLNGEIAVIVRYPTEFGSLSSFVLLLVLALSGIGFGLCLDLYSLVYQCMVMHYAFGHKTA